MPTRVARGGKSLYGASVGILMLEARFPRIPGDVGNALTWPFPVLYRVVRGASPARVVRREAEGLLEPFLEAAAGLVRDGAAGLVTNCGFLSIFQKEIAAHVQVLPRRVEVPVGDVRLRQTRNGGARFDRC